MTEERLRLGALGEEAAVERLERLGYRPLIRNFTCPLGEIDLIAREAGQIVFVEVKTRSDESMGHPAEAVTYRKRQQIRKCAEYFLKRYGIGMDVPCRFDVAAVVTDGRGRADVEVIRDAFGAEG